MKHLVLPGFLLLAAGCAPSYTAGPAPADHPANPEAAQAAYAPPVTLPPVTAPEPLVPASGPAVTGQRADAAGAPAPPEGTAPLPEAVAAGLRTLLDAYLAAGGLLARDEVAGVAAHGQQLGSALEALSQSEVPADPHLWHRLGDDLDAARAEAGGLAGATEIEVARASFGRLSDALVRVLAATGAPVGYDAPVTRFACGMYASAPLGGVWLQLGSDARNPYFGQQMLTCHRDQAPVAPVQPEEAGAAAMPDSHGGH